MYREEKSRGRQLEQLLAAAKDEAARAEDRAAKTEGMAAEYKRGMSRLAGRVAELEKVLKIYDNPHTPPSKRAAGPKKKAAEGSPSPPGRKQGAQEGHPGRTSRPKPDRFEEHRMSECAGCGSRRIRATGRRIRDITEITPPPPPVTTRHTIHVYECAGCGRGGMEPETGLPGRGMLGPRASAEIVGNLMDRMSHTSVGSSRSDQAPGSAAS